MKTKEKIESVEVFSGNSWQAEMLKSLLENANIEAFVLDEIIGTMDPYWSARGGSGAVKVIVSAHDAPSAKIIAEEYERNLRLNDEEGI
ncbi:MAG TPA: DUF2007-related protein [Bacteroidales bacterium]|nr:DUF2007-related protein [Bacteroidales bacterium]